MIRITKHEIEAAPFPHAVKQGVLDESLFQALQEDFPSEEQFLRNQTQPFQGGRSNRINISRADAPFVELMATSDPWREFHDYMNSERYVRFILDLFADHLENLGARLDTENWRFDPFVEHAPRTSVRR